MTRFVPWALVALCFALGRGEPLDQRYLRGVRAGAAGRLRCEPQCGHADLQLRAARRRHRGADRGLDRRPSRPAHADRDRARSAAALATLSASFATEIWHLYVALGIVMGFAGASLSGVLSASLLGRWFPAQSAGRGAGGGLVGVGRRRHGHSAARPAPDRDGRLAPCLYRLRHHQRGVHSPAAGPAVAAHLAGRARTGAERGHPTSGPTVGEALRDWPFWALTRRSAFTSVGIFSLAPQVMVYLLERGLDGAYAARALAVAGFLTPLGMIGFSLARRSRRPRARRAARLCAARSPASARSPWCAGPDDDLLARGSSCCCSAAAWARAGR